MKRGSLKNMDQLSAEQKSVTQAFIAALSKDNEIEIKRLVEDKDLYVNVVKEPVNKSVLLDHIIRLYGDKDWANSVIAKLLQRGANPNVKDYYGETPIYAAKNFEQAKILIAAGARVDVRDNLNMTPLHYAASYGRVEIVKVLLANGVNPCIKNDRGKTANDPYAVCPEIKKMIGAAQKNPKWNCYKGKK